MVDFRKVGTIATTFPRVQMPEDFETDKRLGQWQNLLNGHMSLGSGVDGEWTGHLDGQFVRVKLPLNADAFDYPHGLNRIPVGFWIVDTDELVPLVRTVGARHTNTLLKLTACNATINGEYLLFVF